MDVSFFIKKYFILPFNEGTGYNIVNTTTYAVLLAIIAYIIYYLLKKQKFKFNEELFFDFILISVFGGTFHVLSDYGILKRNLITVSPGIWLTISIPSFMSLIFLKICFPKNYRKIFRITLVVSTFLCLFLMRVRYIQAIAQIICFSVILIAPLLYLVKKIKILNEKTSLYVLALQVLDGTASFISIQYYGYFEQHVIGNLFISLFGPFGMVIMKILFIIPILIFLENEEKKDNSAFFIKMIIGVLGAAPAMRDSIRLIMGV